MADFSTKPLAGESPFVAFASPAFFGDMVSEEDHTSPFSSANATSVPLDSILDHHADHVNVFIVAPHLLALKPQPRSKEITSSPPPLRYQRPLYCSEALGRNTQVREVSDVSAVSSSPSTKASSSSKVSEQLLITAHFKQCGMRALRQEPLLLSKEEGVGHGEGIAATKRSSSPLLLLRKDFTDTVSKKIDIVRAFLRRGVGHRREIEKREGKHTVALFDRLDSNAERSALLTKLQNPPLQLPSSQTHSDEETPNNGQKIHEVPVEVVAPLDFEWTPYPRTFAVIPHRRFDLRCLVGLHRYRCAARVLKKHLAAYSRRVRCEVAATIALWEAVEEGEGLQRHGSSVGGVGFASGASAGNLNELASFKFARKQSVVSTGPLGLLPPDGGGDRNSSTSRLLDRRSSKSPSIARFNLANAEAEAESGGGRHGPSSFRTSQGLNRRQSSVGGGGVAWNTANLQEKEEAYSPSPSPPQRRSGDSLPRRGSVAVMDSSATQPQHLVAPTTDGGGGGGSFRRKGSMCFALGRNASGMSILAPSSSSANESLLPPRSAALPLVNYTLTSLKRAVVWRARRLAAKAFIAAYRQWWDGGASAALAKAFARCCDEMHAGPLCLFLVARELYGLTDPPSRASFFSAADEGTAVPNGVEALFNRSQAPPFATQGTEKKRAGLTALISAKTNEEKTDAVISGTTVGILLHSASNNDTFGLETLLSPLSTSVVQLSQWARSPEVLNDATNQSLIRRLRAVLDDAEEKEALLSDRAAMAAASTKRREEAEKSRSVADATSSRTSVINSGEGVPKTIQTSILSPPLPPTNNNVSSITRKSSVIVLNAVSNSNQQERAAKPMAVNALAAGSLNAPTSTTAHHRQQREPRGGGQGNFVAFQDSTPDAAPIAAPLPLPSSPTRRRASVAFVALTTEGSDARGRVIIGDDPFAPSSPSPSPSSRRGSVGEGSTTPSSAPLTTAQAATRAFRRRRTSIDGQHHQQRRMSTVPTSPQLGPAARRRTSVAFLEANPLPTFDGGLSPLDRFVQREPRGHGGSSATTTTTLSSSSEGFLSGGPASGHIVDTIRRGSTAIVYSNQRQSFVFASSGEGAGPPAGCSSPFLSSGGSALNSAAPSVHFISLDPRRGRDSSKSTAAASLHVMTPLDGEEDGAPSLFGAAKTPSSETPSSLSRAPTSSFTTNTTSSGTAAAMATGASQVLTIGSDSTCASTCLVPPSSSEVRGGGVAGGGGEDGEEEEEEEETVVGVKEGGGSPPITDIYHERQLPRRHSPRRPHEASPPSGLRPRGHHHQRKQQSALGIAGLSGVCTCGVANGAYQHGMAVPISIGGNNPTLGGGDRRSSVKHAPGCAMTLGGGVGATLRGRMASVAFASSGVAANPTSSHNYMTMSGMLNDPTRVWEEEAGDLAERSERDDTLEGMKEGSPPASEGGGGTSAGAEDSPESLIPLHATMTPPRTNVPHPPPQTRKEASSPSDKLRLSPRACAYSHYLSAQGASPYMDYECNPPSSSTTVCILAEKKGMDGTLLITPQPVGLGSSNGVFLSSQASLDLIPSFQQRRAAQRQQDATGGSSGSGMGDTTEGEGRRDGIAVTTLLLGRVVEIKLPSVIKPSTYAALRRRGDKDEEEGANRRPTTPPQLPSIITRDDSPRRSHNNSLRRTQDEGKSPACATKRSSGGGSLAAAGRGDGAQSSARLSGNSLSHSSSYVNVGGGRSNSKRAAAKEVVQAVADIFSSWQLGELHQKGAE